MVRPALRRLKELEEANRRPKEMYAELSLEHRFFIGNGFHLSGLFG